MLAKYNIMGLGLGLGVAAMAQMRAGNGNDLPPNHGAAGFGEGYSMGGSEVVENSRKTSIDDKFCNMIRF